MDPVGLAANVALVIDLTKAIVSRFDFYFFANKLYNFKIKQLIKNSTTPGRYLFFVNSPQNQV
jgi:hypothetical protein